MKIIGKDIHGRNICSFNAPAEVNQYLQSILMSVKKRSYLQSRNDRNW